MDRERAKASALRSLESSGMSGSVSETLVSAIVEAIADELEAEAAQPAELRYEDCIDPTLPPGCVRVHGAVLRLQDPKGRKGYDY